jgi:hypothetical protein
VRAREQVRLFPNHNNKHIIYKSRVELRSIVILSNSSYVLHKTHKYTVLLLGGEYIKVPVVTSELMKEAPLMFYSISLTPFSTHQHYLDANANIIMMGHFNAHMLILKSQSFTGCCSSLGTSLLFPSKNHIPF